MKMVDQGWYLSKNLQNFNTHFTKALEKVDYKIEQIDVDQIEALASYFDVRDSAAFVLAFRLLGHCPEDIASRIEASKKLFCRFTRNNLIAEKYLIGGIERAIWKWRLDLLPKSWFIFKECYDHEILRECSILKWINSDENYVAREHWTDDTFFVKLEEHREVVDKSAIFLAWLYETGNVV